MRACVRVCGRSLCVVRVLVLRLLGGEGGEGTEEWVVGLSGGTRGLFLGLVGRAGLLGVKGGGGRGRECLCACASV